jgi:hypothetical protein
MRRATYRGNLRSTGVEIYLAEGYSIRLTTQVLNGIIQQSNRKDTPQPKLQTFCLQLA